MQATELSIQDVFKREVARIRPYLATMVGVDDAEDLAHEVFIRAYEARASYRSEVPLAAWVRRIARNLAIDHLRRTGASPVLFSPVSSPVPEPTYVKPDPERHAIRLEMRSCIVDLVRRLPERDADVLVLGDMRGLKDQEVADALGITLGAAKIRLHRARARLRRVMERSCELYRDDDGLACDRTS